jgi:hypothetical protein
MGLRIQQAEARNDTAAIEKYTNSLKELNQKFDAENQVYAGLKEQDANE